MIKKSVKKNLKKKKHLGSSPAASVLTPPSPLTFFPFLLSPPSTFSPFLAFSFEDPLFLSLKFQTEEPLTTKQNNVNDKISHKTKIKRELKRRVPKREWILSHQVRSTKIEEDKSGKSIEPPNIDGPQIK